MKTLRIIFTLICAFALALLPLVGIFAVEWLVLPIVIAGISFLLMLYFKRKQEQSESPQDQTPTEDYFTPLSSKPEADDSNNPTADSTESAASQGKTGEAE